MHARAEAFVNTHHSYIDWADRPSRKQHWALYEGQRLVGVWSLGSAYTMPACVRAEVERASLAFNEVACNYVFALHGARADCAGSRFLALLRRDAIARWQEEYGDALRALQTFILPPRTGAVYLADNWRAIGMTSGTGAHESETFSTLAEAEARVAALRAAGQAARLNAPGPGRWCAISYTDTTPKRALWRDVSARERRRALASYRPEQPRLL
jgi:hypothetical protein